MFYNDKTAQVMVEGLSGSTVERYTQMCRRLEAMPGVKAEANSEYDNLRYQFVSNGVSAGSRRVLSQSSHKGSYTYEGFKLWIFPPREFFA